MVSIEDWGNKYNRAPKVTLNSSKYVEGICEMITGEKLHYAKVGLNLSPADTLLFKATIDEESRKICEKEGWIEAICFGVLDVMLIGPMTPVNNFSCVISHVEINPRRSSKLAFRFAARTAVQDFFSKEPYQKIYGWGYKE